MDSEDENKGDSTDLALHEGTPRNTDDDDKPPKPSTSETVHDSLEEEEQNPVRNESGWGDPPENPFQHQTRSDLGKSNRRDSRPDSNYQPAPALPRQFSSRGSAPPTQRQEEFHLQADEDPRLQQIFVGHQLAQFPHLGPQEVTHGSYDYNPNLDQSPYNSGRDRIQNNHFNPEPQTYGHQQPMVQQQQDHYDGHYYVETNIAPLQAPPPPPMQQQNQYDYMNQGPVQPSPRTVYQSTRERQMSQDSDANSGYYHQGDAFAGPTHGQYSDQQEYNDSGYGRQHRGYDSTEQYEYTNDADTVSYQTPQTYSAGTYQSTASSKQQGADYIRKNKNNLKNPPKRSYRGMYGKKKETENEPPFVPQGRRPVQRPAQGLNSPGKGRTPMKAFPNQNPVSQNGQPMTAEDFWKQRAANLEMRKAEKLSGTRNRNEVTLKKYPSESRVDDMRPHRMGPLQQPAHAIAEPIKSEITRSPRGQPITQTVYTEDGQRVSVDINLKLVSPPPIGGPTGPNFNSYQHGAPLQQRYAGHHGNNTYQQPAPPHNTYGYGHTNQFTYRAPVQQGHPPASHNGRQVWEQVRETQIFYTTHFFRPYGVITLAVCLGNGT